MNRLDIGRRSKTIPSNAELEAINQSNRHQRHMHTMNRLDIGRRSETRESGGSRVPARAPQVQRHQRGRGRRSGGAQAESERARWREGLDEGEDANRRVVTGRQRELPAVDEGSGVGGGSASLSGTRNECKGRGVELRCEHCWAAPRIYAGRQAGRQCD